MNTVIALMGLALTITGLLEKDKITKLLIWLCALGFYGHVLLF